MRLRELEVGQMFLMRISGLTGKLEDLWDGPYEVNCKLNDVNIGTNQDGAYQQSQDLGVATHC